MIIVKMAAPNIPDVAVAPQREPWIFRSLDDGLTADYSVFRNMLVSASLLAGGACL
jgi:hypothetical protein